MKRNIVEILYMALTLIVAIFLSSSCTHDVSTIPGPTGLTGPKGPSGAAGSNGYSVVFTLVPATNLQCNNGGFVNTFALDSNNNGVLDSGDADIQSEVLCNGLNGAAGNSGANAVVSTFNTAPSCPNGGITVLTATDTLGLGYPAAGDANFESAALCNGATGVQGTTGVQGPQGLNGSVPEFTPTAVITPCGPNSSQYKEVLLGLQGGDIFGSFTGSSNALTTRNALIPNGSYYDTDDSECYFTVSTDNSSNRAVTWDGSTANGSGPWGVGSATYTASGSSWSETYTAPGN
jgi:hypothetical protein